MSENQGNPQQGPPSRDQEIRAVLWDVMRRRGAGEKLSDTAVVAAHPDLMPELRAELAKVRLIERGQALAAELPHLSTDGSEDLTASRDPAAAGPGDANLPVIPGYRITGRLGFGGMGVVWRAIQLSTQRVVAIKVMSEVSMASQSRRERFLREIQLSVALEHPHIVRIYDGGFKNGLYFYAMEHIPGQHLDDFVAQRRLNRRQVVVLMLGVCRAVQFAHQHAIIHRDLKPSNILVTPDGQPHLVDFGLAKPLDHVDPEETTISREGEVAGTLAYMAPEQAAGRNTEVDTRADVYSLGVILYRLVTGCWPYDLSGSHAEVARRIAEGEVLRPRSANREVDSELEAVLIKALAREPDDRYATAAEFAQDLNNYLEGEPLSAKAPTTFYFLARRMRKYKGRVTLAAALAILLLGSWVISYFRIVAEQKKTLAALAGEKKARNSAVVALASEQVARAAEQKQRTLAEAASSESRLRFSQIAIKNGMEHLETGEQGTALLWFVEALKADVGKAEREFADRVRIGHILRTHPRLEQMWFDEHPVTYLRFLRDGQALLSADNTGVLRIRDIHTGKDLAAPFDHHALAHVYSFSADEGHALTAIAKGTARVIDTRTGASVAEFEAGGLVMAAALATDGQHAMTCTEGGRLRWWDVATGKQLKEFVLGGRFADCATPANGNWFITAVTLDAADVVVPIIRIRVWNVSTGEAATGLYEGPDVAAATVDNEGHLCLTTWGRTANLAANDAEVGPRLLMTRLRLTDGQPAGPDAVLDGSLADGNDPQWLIYTDARSRSSWRAFDRFAWKEVPAASLPPAGTGADEFHINVSTRERLDVSRDHRWLLRSLVTGNAQAWDVAAGKNLGPLLQHGGSHITAHAMDPGHDRLAIATEGVVRLWNLAQPPPTLPLTGEQFFTASRDRRLVVTASNGLRTLRVWDLASRQTIAPALDIGGPVASAVVSPDQRLIVTQRQIVHPPVVEGHGPNAASMPSPQHENDADLWNLAKSQRLATLKGGGLTLKELAFDPAGRFLVLWAGPFQVLDLASLQAIPTPITGHTLQGVALSADGSRLLAIEKTAENGSTAQLWDTGAWKPLDSPLPLPPGTTHAALSEDGQWVAMYNPEHLDVDYLGPGQIRLVRCTEMSGGPAASGTAATTAPVNKGRPQYQPDAFLRPTFRRGEFQTNGVIAVAGNEATGLRIFEAPTGKAFTPRLASWDPFHWCTLSPDGHWLVVSATPPMLGAKGAWSDVWDTATDTAVVWHHPAMLQWFTADQQHAMAVTARGVELVDLTPDTHPVETLESWARLLSSFSFDPSFTTAPLAPGELARLWAHTQPIW